MSAHDHIDAAQKELATLKKNISQSKVAQVRSTHEKELAKATALAWFNVHLVNLKPYLDIENFNQVNALYKNILLFSDKGTQRTKYLESIRIIKKELSNLQIPLVNKNSRREKFNDEIPNFSKLVLEPKLSALLQSRWVECSRCVEHNIPLAATVMMGGLLEALFFVRVNELKDKKVIFECASVPRDRNTGKPIRIQEWTLKHYIDVCHELDWISRSAKDMSEVLRDYRNYVHPHKQARHDLILNKTDAKLFWQITKEMVLQLLN